MERAKYLRFQGMVQTNLIRHVIVEELEYVEPIRALWGGGHSKQKLWLKVLHDSQVGRSSRAVGFVDNDVVETLSGQTG